MVARIAMGRDHIEPACARKRYYERWAEEISQLKPGYDFEIEARRLIDVARQNSKCTSKVVLKKFSDTRWVESVGADAESEPVDPH